MQNILQKLLITLAFSAFSLNANAVNWGATVSLSNGSMEESEDRDDIYGDVDFYTIGLTLDTGLADRVFNYRGTLAYLKGELDGEFNGTEASVDFDGLAINNTFGLRVGGEANQRFWIAPAIDVQLVDADGYDDGVGISFGPSVGFDLYTEQGATFSMEAGYRRGSLSFFDQDDSFFGDEDLDVDTKEFFARATVFF